MKKSTMQLMNTAAKKIKQHLPALKVASFSSVERVSEVLEKDLLITITPPELDGLVQTDDMLLFLLRALGIRINLSVSTIDWWYYNKMSI